MTDKELFGISEQLNDTISRQAAIDAIADMYCKSDEDGYVWIIRGDAWARIDALPSAQQWISCEERLPYAEYGKSDTVLTTCGYRDVEDTSIRWIRLLYFNGGNWCYPTGETYEAKVYAWCPLPEPWKGGPDGTAEKAEKAV